MNIRRAWDRRKIIGIDENGIWLDAIQRQITWENVAATYIRRVSFESGDNSSTSYSLLVYFYDEEKDDFLEATTNFDGLEENPAHLARKIEAAKLIVNK